MRNVCFTAGSFTYMYHFFFPEPEKSDTQLPLWWLCWLLIKLLEKASSRFSQFHRGPRLLTKRSRKDILQVVKKKYGRHTQHRPETSAEKTFYKDYPANLFPLRSNNLILLDFQQKEHAFGSGSRWVCFMCSSWKAAFMCRQTQRHLGLS